MTITVGSRWVLKRWPQQHATVVYTFVMDDVKYVVYRPDIRTYPNELKIATSTHFLKIYRHPDTTGDVPS